jgi:prolipoprotein diacylglyceryl transferase
VIWASIPSPSFDEIALGPLRFHVYGLMYILALVAAVIVTARRWAARGGDPAFVQEVALFAFPAGIVGGRLYHVITSWNELPDAWWGPFAIWEGGMGIIGGIALGALAGVWVMRRHGVSVADGLDAAAPGLLVAMAIGRLGNWFNQELFGPPTSLPWGLEIDPEHRPARYADDPTFQPTFLYEILWDLALAAALVWLERRRPIRPPGLFALYVAGYGAFRAIVELFLRVDPANELFGLRINLFVSVALLIGGLVWFCLTQRSQDGNNSTPRPRYSSRPHTTTPKGSRT